YLFGIGLALWALTSWVALRERAVALRLAVSTLFVLALFFCHLFAVGVYGLGLLAFELQRLLGLRWRGPLAVDGAAKPGLPPWLDAPAGRRHHLLGAATRALRHVHGGPAPADCAGVHDHCLRPSRPARRIRAPGLCHCLGSTVGRARV